MIEDVILAFLFLGTFITIIGVIFNYLNNERKRRYALIEKALESGQQIPENLLAEPKKNEKRSFAYFKNGILFTFCAAALWVVYLIIYYQIKEAGYQIRGAEAATLFPLMFVGAFFTAFGLAWLLIGWLRLVQEKNEQNLQQ